MSEVRIAPCWQFYVSILRSISIEKKKLHTNLKRNNQWLWPRQLGSETDQSALLMATKNRIASPSSSLPTCIPFRTDSTTSCKASVVFLRCFFNLRLQQEALLTLILRRHLFGGLDGFCFRVLSGDVSELAAGSWVGFIMPADPIFNPNRGVFLLVEQGADVLDSGRRAEAYWEAQIIPTRGFRLSCFMLGHFIVLLPWPNSLDLSLGLYGLLITRLDPTEGTPYFFNCFPFIALFFFLP